VPEDLPRSESDPAEAVHDWLSLSTQQMLLERSTQPYGMIGRIEETSASFEARSAPRSYPTATEVEGASQRRIWLTAVAAALALLFGAGGADATTSADSVDAAQRPRRSRFLQYL
jgi:hypothetical protein